MHYDDKQVRPINLSSKSEELIDKFLASGEELRQLEPYNDINQGISVVPAAMPFLNENWLNAMFSSMAVRTYMLKDGLARERWQLLAERFQSGKFLCPDFFAERIRHPLFLRARMILRSFGLDFGTEPSREENVVLPPAYMYPRAELLTEAYPDMKSLECRDPGQRKTSWVEAPVYTFLTENEMKHILPKNSVISESYVELFSEKMAEGKFYAPEAFASRFWSGRRREGRLRAIRKRPELAFLMTKADMFELLDVRGVLKNCLDKGWVTRFNHDDVYSNLTTDEDKAILLEWDGKHNMQGQMDKLKETRMSADPFSTTVLRKDWFIHHSEDGVSLRLKPYVSSETVYLPSHVSGKPVISVSTPMRNDCSDGDVHWHEIRNFSISSDLDPELLKDFVQLPDFWDQRLSSFGDGPLKVVPGAVIYGSDVVYGINGKELILPEGIERIPYGAFAFHDFERVSLPSTLKTIEGEAFRQCRQLTDVEIPCSVGAAAFENCVNLRRIRINGSINVRAFWECPNIEEIEFGPACRCIETQAFGCFPDTLTQRIPHLRLFRTRIDREAFKGHAIGKAEFFGCQFNDREDSDPSSYDQRLNLTVDNLYLTRCSGTLLSVGPVKEHYLSSIYRGLNNHTGTFNSTRFLDKDEGLSS